MIFRPAYFITCDKGCHGKIASQHGAFCIKGMTSKEQCHEAVRILRELDLISDEENFALTDQIDDSPLPEQDRIFDRRFSLAMGYFARGFGTLADQLQMATEQSPADFIHYDPNPGNYIIAELIDPDAPPD